MPDQSPKTTPASALVFDAAPPIGPAAVLGPTLVIAGILFGLASTHTSVVLLLMGVMATLVHGLRPRRRPRKTRVFCNLGGLAVAGVGKIRARDIVGATTARFGDHVSLMLAHKKRKSPIILELDSETALLAICKSLGIGHHGFGSVEVPVKATGVDSLRHASYAATLAAIVCAIATRHDSQDGFASLALMMLFAAIVLALANVVTPQPKIRMTSNGVFLPTREGVAFAPFNAIENIDILPHAIVTSVRTDAKMPVLWQVDVSRSWWRRQGSTQAELEHLVAQIRAAVDRAHGKFLPKTEPENALAKLRRAAGEPIRAWLARLDTLTAGAGSYREMSVEQPELWTLLEDPEAEADTRAAAARVLSRSAGSELKVRVANVLATERNERTRARIAASLDDDALTREEEAEQAERAYTKS